MQAYTKTVSRAGTAWEIDVTPECVRPEWGTHMATVVWHVRVSNQQLGIAAFLLPPQDTASSAERVAVRWITESATARASQERALIKALGGTIRTGNFGNRRPRPSHKSADAPDTGLPVYAPPVHHADTRLLHGLETRVCSQAERDALITAAIARKKTATR